MIKLIHISEGMRIFLRSIRIKFKGYKKFKGNASEICEQIIEKCWNAKDGYYQVSNGNYNEFYCRDFGICTDALIELGYKDRVIKTLEYALAKFSKHGKITQVISHRGTPFEFPSYAADSLPFLLRSLNRSGAKSLIEKYKEFLNYEIAKYYEIVFDESTGMVKKDPKISGMKDYALRISPCYHNSMLAMLSIEIDKAGLPNPFKKYDFKKMIKDKFWRETHFIDDLSDVETITGDANVFPFWCGIFDEKDMLKKAVGKMRENKLDTPLPLRYYHKKIKEHDMIWLSVLVNDWESDTAWLHVGMCYLEIVKKLDKELFNKYLEEYLKFVEKHGNFLEVLEPDGKPVKGAFFCADDGMLWSSMLLRYLNSKKQINN